MMYKAKSYYKRFGFGLFIIKIICKIFFMKSEIEKYKELVWDKVKERYGLEVAFGPFKGMKLSPNAWWSKKNMTAQVLGIYESNVIFELENYAGKFSNFIDIGAADGYYAVGSVFNGMYKNSHAFEINELGRKTILETAKINNCEKQISIYGEANSSKIRDIIKKDGSALVIIDIEGGEFDLLSEDMLNSLRQCVVICELHPFMFSDGANKLSSLVKRCDRSFEISFNHRKIYQFPECDLLDTLPDDARLLAFSEGREAAMQWMILVPKTENSRRQQTGV